MFDYVGTPAIISEIERRMKISDDVMKFLSIKLDEYVDLEAFQAAELAKKEAALASSAAWNASRSTFLVVVRC